MPNGHPSSIAELVGEMAYVVQVEVAAGGTEIQVHVDIDVELTSYLEDTVDLAVGVAVGVGSCSHH